MQTSEVELKHKTHRPNLVLRDSERKRNDCYKVLFVCPDNSVRSILAEAILKRWGGQDFCAFSAGIHPATDVNPLAIDLLKSQRVCGQDLEPKGCNEFLKHDAQCMNFIISIEDQRPNDLPAEWPGNPRIFRWHISDPVVVGQPAERALAFRRTFRELENRIKLFILVYEREAARRAAA